MTGELMLLTSTPTLHWIPMVTLLVLLASQPWRHFERGSLPLLLGLSCQILIVAGLLLDTVGMEPWFWCTLAALHFWWVAKAYYIADNHHYLMGYWCISVGLALAAGDDVASSDLLAQSATLLIGLCFLLATVSKLINGRYRDGSYFTYALLTDVRFLPLASSVAGLNREIRSQHATALGRISSGESAQERVFVPSSIRTTARWLTWWTVIVEALLAMVFLLPMFGSLRVPILVIFCVSTYVFIPVVSFGQILLVMALALPQSSSQRILLLWIVIALPFASYLAFAMRRAVEMKWERGNLQQAGLTPQDRPLMNT